MKKLVIFLALLMPLSLVAVLPGGSRGSQSRICCCYREVDVHSVLLARKETCCCCGKKEQISHSYMSARPINQNLNIEFFLMPYLLLDKKGPTGASFDISTIFQESMVTEGTKRYFLPTCHTTLLVSGDCNQEDAHERDIRAEWLGLDKNFRGRFTIAPKQKQFAFVMEYNQDLSRFASNTMLEDMWFNIRAPLVFVDNDMQLQQFDVVNEGTEFPMDILEAFSQRAWNYGRICNGQSRVRLAEIYLSFGRAYLWDNNFLMNYYTLGRVPTGNKQNAKFMFDPVVGNNNHWGLGGGMDIQWLLNRDPSDYAFCFFAELEATFFVRRHEQRIFDLKCKPWSRYLLLTNRNGPLGNTTPGVNVLTREVKVRPWGAVDLSTGLRINTERMQFEVSYNLWTHPDERVCLRCPFGDEWGIAGTVDPLTCPTFTGPTPPDPAPFVDAVTASRSTIAHLAPNDQIRIKEDDGTIVMESIFVPIRENDLDFNSAEAQGTLNHKASAAIGFIHNGVRSNAIFGFGFYFDYPQKNTALKTAGAWAKVGASF